MSDASAEYLDSHAGAPLPQGSRSRRPLLLGSAAVAGLAVVGGAAWGAWWWFSEGPQAAEALPASSIAYVGLTLDPSGGQKLEALRTLQKFPAIAEELDLDGSPADIDVKEALGSAFLEGAPCDVSDYDQHLEPWLGDRMGLAAFPVDGEPQPLAAIESTDAGAAEEGMVALTSCGFAETVYEVREGWVLLAPDRDVLDAALDALDEGRLADDEDFSEWTGEAGGDGIVTMYLAPEAATYLSDALGPVFGELTGNGYGSSGYTSDPDEQIAAALDDFEGAAAQIRFAGGAAELELVAGLPAGERYAGGGDAAGLVASMPDDTVVAGGSSLNEDLVAGWQARAEGSQSPGGESDDLTGLADGMLGALLTPGALDLPALLGDAVAVAIGPDVDLEGFYTGTTTEVPLAVVSTGERTAADDAAADVGAGLGVLLGTEPSVAGEDGRVVLGLSPTWVDAVTEGGSLGDQEAFQSALPETDGAAGLLFVDVDAVLTILRRQLPETAEESGEVMDNLEPLDALGVSSEADAGTLRALLRITTD